MRDNALSSRPAAVEMVAAPAPKGGDTRAPRPSDGGIGQTLTLAQTEVEPEADNRMLVDADLRIVKLEADPNPVVPHPEHPTPRDDRLTLSQLSPRKTVVERDDAKRDMDTTDAHAARDDEDVGMDVDKDGIQHPQRGAPSPMRPSVKRSASALSTVSASADPRGMKRVQGQEQGQEQAQRVPSAVATRGARGRGGLGRGVHSGRVVSAPAQVRPSRQPMRQAREASVTASAGAKSTSTVSVQPAASSRARIAAPKTKETDMSDSRRQLRPRF